MKTPIYFKPKFELLSTIQPTHTISDIDQETSVYSASPKYLREHGGPISHAFLDAVPQAFYDKAKALSFNVIVDVRIHRLNRGEFPAVPGWHVDGDIRKDYFSQPDISKQDVLGDHIICAVSSHEDGVSNFEIIPDPLQCDLDMDDPDRTVYAQLHEHIEAHSIPRITTRDGQMYFMNSQTIHRATPARVRGWRIFFRMSMYHQGYLSGEGKIAKQQQVYILSEGNGW